MYDITRQESLHQVYVYNAGYYGAHTRSDITKGY